MQVFNILEQSQFFSAVVSRPFTLAIDVGFLSYRTQIKDISLRQVKDCRDVSFRVSTVERSVIRNDNLFLVRILLITCILILDSSCQFRTDFIIQASVDSVEAVSHVLIDSIDTLNEIVIDGFKTALDILRVCLKLCNIFGILCNLLFKLVNVLCFLQFKSFNLGKSLSSFSCRRIRP